jgi:ACS family glucarate transporter-like MFS transporter
MVSAGWRIALIASAVPALAIALLWLRIREPAPVSPPETKNATMESGNSSAKGNIRSGSFYLLTASYTLQGYVGYIFVSWFYLYLVQERNFGLLSGAWMSSLPWILSIVSIPLGGLISDRLVAGRAGKVWGRRIVPLTGMAFSGVLISIGAHTGSAVMAAICLAFATAFILCVEGPFWAMMMKIAGKQSGTAGGIMNMGSNLGGLLSPALTPVIASYLGWENALHIAALLAIIGAVLWLFIKPVN